MIDENEVVRAAEESGRDDELAEQLARIAQALGEEGALQGVLDRICELAVEAIPSCEHAGITIVRRKEVYTPAASDDLPVAVDRVQYETGEGPCVDAIRDHEVYLTRDLAADDRWAEFGPRAVEETGVRSMLSFRLVADDDTLGALNLYSKTPDHFGDDDRHIGALFATHASLAMASATEVDQLRRALVTRDVIATAKGILMAREGLDEEQAFALLRQKSRNTNTRLTEIAAEICESAG
jgi:GAF domain-containing protein